MRRLVRSSVGGLAMLALAACGGHAAAPKATATGSPAVVRAQSASSASTPTTPVLRPPPPTPLAVALPLYDDEGTGGCHEQVTTRDTDAFSPIYALHGATCATAVHVVELFAARLELLISAGRYCDPTLCTTPRPHLAGFSCAGDLIGDSYWSLTCSRGLQRVGAYSGA